MFWFIVLLLLAGAGFYFYQKMIAIEREIREEQDAGQAETKAVEESKKEEVEPEEEDSIDPQIVTPEVADMASKADPVADESFSLEDEILGAVNNLPGMKQTELYASFADVNKKQLQQLLKEMDEGGKLRREKKGSSYLLYPAET